MACTANHRPMIGFKVGLAVTTALASVALAGCATTNAAPRAETSFSKAQVALGKGEVSNAVTHAEAAVLADPRNPAYRATLGAAYLEAGRFQAAATSFSDALELGDSDPRTVLSYALAETALGNNGAAVNVLDQWQDDLDPADYGLALSLAGQPDRGVHVLANALRGGQNSPKVRQNLAYAYALQGNWRAARLMAAEDVPADMIDDRIGEWAVTTHPEAFQARVAGLLRVTPTTDSGQPRHLALANFPDHGQMVAEAAAEVPSANEADGVELAAVEPAAPVASAPVPEAAPAADRQTSFADAFVAPQAPVSTASDRVVSHPVVQPVPASTHANVSRAPQSAPAPVSRIAQNSPQRRMAATTGSASATHLVQLGSFSSRANAERATAIYQKRYTQLDGRDMVITQAQVNGKTYFRVAAAGFGASEARSMCNAVRSGGAGCLAYAASRPLPGAVDRGIRVASR